MSAFTFAGKKFLLRGREIVSQADIDSIFLNPKDDVVKDAIKRGYIVFDEALYSENKAVKAVDKK